MADKASKAPADLVLVKRYELAHKRWLNAIARNDVQAQYAARDAEHAHSVRFGAAEWNALFAARAIE